MTTIKPTHLLFAGFLLLFLSCKKDIDTPPNKVPVINAGLSQTITLPVDSVSLIGSATDEDGQIVAFLWSQVSGPASSFIINPGSSSTKIKFTKEGTYVFQLMATDNAGATGVDTIIVLVNPSPIMNLTSQPANNPTEIKFINNNGTDGSDKSSPDLAISAWTKNNVPFTGRGIIKFDLSSIPVSATIISANLYLYSYPSPTINGNGIDANFGTDNTMLVQQVTSTWDRASINWFNLPATTTTNQVIAPQAPQGVLDLNLNVTDMVSTMVNSNANNGFFLKLQNETIYNSRIFVGSYNTTYTTKYPKLVVVYR